MKKTFPGYFALTEVEFEKLWGKCIFCIDSNILLNLYRYSKSTRAEFLDLLKSIKDRLWIPHQAAFEYLKNRLDVIAEQRKSYEKMIDSFSRIIEEFKDIRKHPFIEPALLDELNSVYVKVKNNLEENKKEHDSHFEDDTLQNEIVSLLENRIGPEYPVIDLKALSKEGEERYKLKTPPGFKDVGKGSDAHSSNIYGDFIVWKQILDKAKKDKVDIILLTDDRKEDWWWKFNGKTIGPRPELIQEFQQQTNQKYYMYQPDRFMEFAEKHLSKPVKAEAIQEVKDIRHENEKRSGFLGLLPEARRYDLIRKFNVLKKQYSEILKTREELQHQLDRVKIIPSIEHEEDIPIIEERIAYISLQEKVIRENMKKLQSMMLGENRMVIEPIDISSSNES